MAHTGFILINRRRYVGSVRRTALIALAIAGLAVFIYGDVASHRSVRSAGLALVALGGAGLIVSAARARAR